MKKNIGILLILLLLLCACGRNDNYQPFTPLSKETVSPEREAAIQASLNGNGVILSTPTAQPTPTSELYEMPSFDEDSFFAEVSVSSTTAPSGIVPTEESPFDNAPAVVVPTAVPTQQEPINPYGTAANGLTTYTLQAGEDLICLGRRFNISVSQLLSTNGFDTADDAKVGDVIMLPRTSTGWTQLDGYGGRILARHPGSYVVQRGDSLFSIACSYGDVRPEDIAAANNLNLGDTLTAGTQLRIP